MPINKYKKFEFLIDLLSLKVFLIFQINYYLKKTNKAIDALFCFLQKIFNKKKSFSLKIFKFFIHFNHYLLIQIL